MTHKGKIKWFDGKKGYGWIIADGIVGDVFFHHTAIAGGAKINDHDPVSFNIVEGRGGRPQAKGVTPVNGEAAIVFGDHKGLNKFLGND